MGAVRIALAVTLILAAPPLAAQAEALLLEPIVITARRSAADWLDTPAAIGTVELERSQQGTLNLAVDEALHRLPGIYIQNRYNFAQGERLSVRGFGARSSFGIRGLRVLLDGLPLTMPDGQTQLDAVDLDLVERAELIRGPASALYGNAAGGVLLLSTREPPQRELGLSLTGGEFGHQALRLEAGGRRGRLAVLAAAERSSFDGSRRHSGFEEAGFYGKLVYDGDAYNSTFILSLSDSRADDPGALTQAELAGNRRQAAPNSLLFDAGESSTEIRLGWLLQRPLDSGRELQLRLFGGYREFANRLPFGAQPALGINDDSGGQVVFDRLHGGLGLQYNLDGLLLGRPGRLSIGADIEAQRDDRRRHDNLPGGGRGSRMLAQLEQVESLGLYMSGSWQPASRWTTAAAARIDSIRLAVDDRFPRGADQSGSRRLNELSVLAGIGYALAPQHRLYANIGTGFEAPTTSELANPAGRGFNPDLEPQQARSLELGLKGQLARLRYEATLFAARVRDELVRFELPGQTGRAYYRNADRSQRRGLELSVDWQPSPAWHLSAAYTHLRAVFDRYSENPAFSGNRLPGTPRQHLFLELAYDTSRHYAAVDLLAVARIHADDANSAAAPGHALINARAGLRRPLDGLQAEVFAGVRNLFDRDYISNVRPNAAFERYYEPGPGRYFYAGVALRY